MTRKARWRSRSARATSDERRGETEAWGFESFMQRNLEKDLLRFTTAGSVDDGKSTLIGRLLHDSKSVFEDQLAAGKKSRINRSTGAVDFSLLTDGLRAEREQGIRSMLPTVILKRRAANSYRGHARARTVHTKHGHGRFDRESRGDPDRFDKRRSRADSAAHLHRVAARDSKRARGDQQDGPRGLQRGSISQAAKRF